VSKLKPLGLISVILLLTIGALLAASLQRVYQQQQEFDNSLKSQRIEPSFQGVESYVKAAVQPGISKPDLLKRLALLGVIGHSGVDLPACEEIRVFLLHEPGDKFPFLPGTPPVFLVDVCYDGGLINRVGAVKVVYDE
jgi:hypothetical protein